MAGVILTLDQVLTRINNGFASHLFDEHDDGVRAIAKNACEWDYTTLGNTIMQIAKLCPNHKPLMMEIAEEAVDTVNLVDYVKFVQSIVLDLVNHNYIPDQDGSLATLVVVVGGIRVYAEFIVGMEKIIDSAQNITQKFLAEKFKRSCNA